MSAQQAAARAASGPVQQAALLLVARLHSMHGFTTPGRPAHCRGAGPTVAKASTTAVWALLRSVCPTAAAKS